MARWTEEIRRRLAPAGLEPAREEEIAQELGQHLDDRYAEMRAMGRSEGDARQAAIDELGEEIRMREELARVTPAAAGILPPGTPVTRRPLAERLQDIRYALRMLRRSPGFTAVAVLTLAVGIGATVAIVSAAYSVLYRPLEVTEADRMVVPVSVNSGRGVDRGSVPFADYEDWRNERDIFERVALFSSRQMDIAGGETPERVGALQVSAEYFDAMKVRPLAGRLLVPSDHDADAAPVVVIAESVWKRRFGGDAEIVGKPIRLAGTVRTIVGVVAPQRLWPAKQDVWLPMQPSALPEDERVRRDNMIFMAVARLQPAIHLTQARARVQAVASRVARDHPASRKDWTSDVIPLRQFIVEPDVRLGMMVLLGGVGFLLLIACVNLANLLLARGADRAREMALRSALGASRPRLLRQLMTESLVLAVAGGVAGLLLARWLLQALKSAVPPELPMADRLEADGITVAIALGLTCVTAVLFGLLPALAASTFNLADGLREGGRTSGAGRRTGRLRDALVVTQVALAVILLSGAGLMLRSFDHLLRVDPGVDVDRILTGRVALPAARYPRPARAQFYERLTDALAAAPGVESAAAASYLPAGGRGLGLGRVFLVEGQPEPPSSSDHPAAWNVITPEYFHTAGISVIRGRAFAREDTTDSRPVMIINETMARRVFGDADPLGRKMRSWRDENVLREIIGVARNVRYFGLADEERSLVYVPHRQDSWTSMTVIVRTPGDPSSLAETLRREVARLDRDVAVARIAPLSAMAADSIGPQRFGAVLLTLFAAAAVLLAGLGVYGVMSYVVAQRTHELGVRLALGARPPDLFALVVGRGLLLTGAGAAFGIIGALALGPLLRGLLYGVSSSDPATLVLVPLVLATVAFLACAIPGRRAARTEPLEALRR